ncbi:Ribose ABC transport system, periplasmic ribose-binding protein RbsB [Labilithrix luteola]|uniref:Ribose ABC transport system, periplasmic ribose-binding protein RbsB n=1 Tax=Labilithrix luteola TaxID=1391654 RepID=A0A0K1Q8B1_9BACT|nr:substrate-binding domain-containing protein [Labilithrix luteola]AKV01978.1 Ribose ABC transport system, periplasmic ribose-binding protein RbsB [Labilithrix luteola]
MKTTFTRIRASFGGLTLVALVALVAAGCSKDSKPSDAADGGKSPSARLKIAVIPKGTTHEFWKSVHAGAVKAAREADVDIVWKGPLKEDDLKAQVDVVSSFVAQGVNGIVLAPLNDAALRAPVKAAKAAKIPVVVVDSDLQGDDHVSFVATDNQAAGKIAATELARLLAEKGSAVVLRYQEGSASTQNREKGFLDGIKSAPDVKVLSDNQYGGATTETAFAKGESLLLAQKAQTGSSFGVFTPNESTTFGMLLALRKSNLNKKVKFVGFDASEKLVSALKDGDVDGLVVQNPFNMGYLAVKTMADHLRGKPVEKRIDTGARLVTKANLDDPGVREVVAPDLGKWLEE